jgi:hypothetical protein
MGGWMEGKRREEKMREGANSMINGNTRREGENGRHRKTRAKRKRDVKKREEGRREEAGREEETREKRR